MVVGTVAQGLHAYAPAVCSISPPIAGVPCQQRIPILSGNILTVHTSLPCGQGLSASMLQYTGSVHGTTPVTIPTTVVPGMQTVVPYYSSSPVQGMVSPYTDEKTLPCPIVHSPITSPTYAQVLPPPPPSQMYNTQLVPASPVNSDMCTTPTVLSPTTPTVLPTTPTVCQLSPNTLTVPSWKQSYGMEQVWQEQFKRFFTYYAPHVWLLLPVDQKPSGLWNTHVDSAKVRFCCEDCGHGWTSMKGRVGFWFILNPTSGEGVVCLKLYGQQCERCKTGIYEPAMWYPEEVEKVLVNIYIKVGEAYYGIQQAPYNRNRRPGKPRTPHNSELCQACKDGICSERR